MFLSRLKLINFRNFKEANFEFNQTTLLVGPNGTGKTSILEAIYYLAVLRSFRGARDSEVIRRGENIGRIAAELLFERNEAESRNSEIALVLTGGGKIAFRGGKKIPPAKIIGTIKAVVFAPEMLAIVAGPPVLRRRELDLLLSQISYRYLYFLVQYQKILRQRNAVLASPASTQHKISQLELWDRQLVGAGREIVGRRRIALGALSKETGRLFGELTGCFSPASHPERRAQRGTEGSLTIVYNPSAAAENLAGVILKSRLLDLKYKQTTIGPHRDNWQFKLGNADMAHFGSRGEIRSAVLALKIASAKLLGKDGELPILLLDDVLAELDLAKSGALDRLITDYQTVITATDAEKIPGVILGKAKVYRLN